MKIAMIGQKRVPSRLGGIEVAVEALAVRMAAAGHDVTLYNCVRYNRKNSSEKLLWNKRYHNVRIKDIPVPDLKGISAVAGSIAATFLALFGKYDCIHYHAEGPAAMAFLPHLFGIRTVVTIHGLDWKRSKWGSFASWYLKRGEKTAVVCADEIIVLSSFMKQYFLDTYGRHTVMIPNGIDKPVRRAADKITALWNLEKDGYILYLGRIVPEKGLELLIQAFKKIKTDKKLVIAGGISDTKPYFEKLKKMAETDRRILFTGFVRGEVLDELYSNSYLYCLPSELEGMPISLLEAMSYGNCCLCSDIPECAEVMENQGYLFQSGSVQELTKTLQILCREPELIERGRELADRYILERYNWDDAVKKTLKLYRSEKQRKTDRGETIESSDGE